MLTGQRSPAQLPKMTGCLRWLPQAPGPPPPAAVAAVAERWPALAQPA